MFNLINVNNDFEVNEATHISKGICKAKLGFAGSGACTIHIHFYNVATQKYELFFSVVKITITR